MAVAMAPLSEAAELALLAAELAALLARLETLLADLEALLEALLMSLLMLLETLLATELADEESEEISEEAEPVRELMTEPRGKVLVFVFVMQIKSCESLTWGADDAGDGGEYVGGVLGGNEGAGGDEEDGGELHGD